MIATDELRLLIEEPNGRQTERKLRGERFLIGRDARAAIPLLDGAVSRRHAELVRDPFGSWWINDLGSRHGTRVNNHLIREHQLSASDRIQIAEFALLLELPHDSAQLTTGQRLPWLPSDIDDAPQALTTVDASATATPVVAHLQALVKLSASLAAELEAAARAELLCRFIAEQFPTRCTTLLLQSASAGEDAVEELARASNQGAPESTEIHISRTVMNLVREERRTVTASNLATAGFDAQLSVAADSLIQGVLACPLDDAGEQLRVVYVITKPQFLGGEWLALVTLAAAFFSQAEATHQLHRRIRTQAVLQADLERAREAQARLLPKLSSPAGWSIAFSYTPCRWVGGDYLDVINLPDGRLLLLVADVSGKGLGAAMTTGNLHAFVHANVSEDFRLDRFARNVDQYLERTLLSDSFVTVLMIALDPASGRFDCLSAGHPPPFLMAPGAPPQLFDVKPHPPLGLMGPVNRMVRSELAPGAWLLGTTDGASDTCNETGDRLEDEGLHKLVTRVFGQQPPTSDASAAIARLERELDAFQGKAWSADDRTLLLVGRLPG